MMMSFSENKLKRDAKHQATDAEQPSTGSKRRDEKRTDKQNSQAAWHDASVDKMNVHIEDISRLRKLKH